MTRWLSGLVIFGVLPLAACGSRWSPSCKTEVSLSAAFSTLNLPADQGRVCESDDKKTRLEFQGADKEKWRSALEQSVTSAGFAKESCPSYCVYTKGTQHLQVIVGTIGTTWVSTALILSTGHDASASAGAAPPAPTPTPTPTTAAPVAHAGGKGDMAACNTTLKQCTPACGKDTVCINRCLASFRDCTKK
jgi:hypothetical protein